MKVCRCGAIVEKRCERCSKPSSNQLSETACKRGYDRQWRNLRARYVAVYPLCERCSEQGKTTPMEEVHHKIPISQAPELRLQWNNLMSVCRPCHREIEVEA